MVFFTETRIVKQAYWADEIVKYLAIQTEDNEEELDPIKTKIVLNPSETDDKIRLVMSFCQPPLNKYKKNNIELAAWLFSSVGTERNNELIFKQNFQKIDFGKKIIIPPINAEKFGYSRFKLRIGIIKEATKSNFPPMIISDKIFTFSTTINEFPTGFCSFSEKKWPNGVWYLEIKGDPTDDFYLNDGSPNITIWFNQDFANVVKLLSVSSRRDPQLKTAHLVLVNTIVLNTIYLLSQWIFKAIDENLIQEDDILENEDSIGYKVLKIIMKLLECDQKELIEKWQESHTIFLVELQQAFKLSKQIII